LSLRPQPGQTPLQESLCALRDVVAAAQATLDAGAYKVFVEALINLAASEARRFIRWDDPR
jgi:hypothetical protein